MQWIQNHGHNGEGQPDVLMPPRRSRDRELRWTSPYVFYYVTRNGHEVDFLLRSGGQNRELIQVCYSLGQQNTRARELRALSEAASELGVSKLKVITIAEDATERLDGHNVEIVSAQTWCLA